MSPQLRGEEAGPPEPCPRCGNTARLFTPNARRHPYRLPPVYEAAWQCTRCGYLEFLTEARDETATTLGESEP